MPYVRSSDLGYQLPSYHPALSGEPEGMGFYQFIVGAALHLVGAGTQVASGIIGGQQQEKLGKVQNQIQMIQGEREGERSRLQQQLAGLKNENASMIGVFLFKTAVLAGAVAGGVYLVNRTMKKG
jgi:hypothetical protein